MKREINEDREYGHLLEQNRDWVIEQLSHIDTATLMVNDHDLEQTSLLPDLLAVIAAWDKKPESAYLMAKTAYMLMWNRAHEIAEGLASEELEHMLCHP